jgi:hypothetical protein
MVLLSKTWVLEVAESGPAFGESPPNHPWALPIVKHEVNITTPQQTLKHFLSTYEGVQVMGFVHLTS